MSKLYQLQMQKHGRNRSWVDMSHFCDERSDAEESARLIAIQRHVSVRVKLIRDPTCALCEFGEVHYEH